MPPSSAFDAKSRPKKAPLLPKLRGQFAEFLNRDSPVALACSASLPVSVYGTGTYDLPRGFSWQRGAGHFGSEEPRIRFSALCAADLPTAPPTNLDAHIHPRADLSSCVTPSAHRPWQTMPCPRVFSPITASRSVMVHRPLPQRSLHSNENFSRLRSRRKP